MSPQPHLAELAAEARYATDRVALYRQRLYGGTGDLRRLAELERVADGAQDRLRNRRSAKATPAAKKATPAGGGQDLSSALADVGLALDDPRLSTADRMPLLQRQAELGDLRDELALRARRRAGADSRATRSG